MIKGFIAQKLGMSQKFLDNGDHVPVTVLLVDDHFVVEKKTDKLALGTVVVKETRINKPQRDSLKKKNLPALRHVREIACDNPDEFEVGQTLTSDAFAHLDYIDVTAYTKGRGFSGVVKRHNFSTLRATHGVSAVHRSHGSTGQRQDPGRVFKNKKMAGHYGVEKCTVQNLKIVEIIPEKKLVLVKGAIPGPKGGLILVKKAVKKGGAQ